MDKISIRFYNNKEVRAIWGGDDSSWYYSATDIVRAINNETDYVKAGNYWRWLKKKLAAQGVQPVSDTHEFKLVGPDGKKRVADVMDDNGVLLLAKHRKGATGDVLLTFRGEFTRFENPEDSSLHRSLPANEGEIMGSRINGDTPPVQSPDYTPFDPSTIPPVDGPMPF